MRPSSTSPVPTSLQFNASLPMASSNQPSSLPATFLQSAQVPPLVTRHMPQPLLPLSTTSMLGDPDQHNQNPFLWADLNKLLKWQFNHRLDLKLEHTFIISLLISQLPGFALCSHPQEAFTHTLVSSDKNQSSSTMVTNGEAMWPYTVTWQDTEIL